MTSGWPASKWNTMPPIACPIIARRASAQLDNTPKCQLDGEERKDKSATQHKSGVRFMGKSSGDDEWIEWIEWTHLHAFAYSTETQLSFSCFLSLASPHD